ncbi:MAG: CHAT domain-containing protein [Planctomycetes bacterium]|nr:CHAT domain-containing protein [Planctomycetota bacterium]
MNAADADRLEAAIDGAMAEGNLALAQTLSARYLAEAGAPKSQTDPARAPWFRAAYLASQVSLAAGFIQHGLIHLTPVLAVVDQLPGDLPTRVHLFAAEAYARLHRLEEARVHLAAVSQTHLRGDPLLHLHAVRTRLALGEVGSLGDDVAVCARSLQARGELANSALLRCEEGQAWERAGNLDRAEACWRAAAREANHAGDPPVLAAILVQLGRLDHLRGRLPEALTRYDAALPLAAAGTQRLEIDLRRVLVLMDANQAQLALATASQILEPINLTDLPEEIRPLAQMVAALVRGEPFLQDSEHQAFLALAQGERTEARRLYQQALEGDPTPERRARRSLALGLLALDQEDRNEANAWLRRAEELARQGDYPEIRTRALEGLGRVAAELSCDETSAYALFEKAAIVGEGQASLFTHASDAAAYRARQGGALRQLLRSACRRGDLASAFRFQELERGRLLLDLWRKAPSAGEIHAILDSRELQTLNAEIESHERDVREQGAGDPSRRTTSTRLAELAARRDHLLTAALRERTRVGGAALPPLPDVSELQSQLDGGTVYVSPVALEDALFLLLLGRDRAQVVPISCAIQSLARQVDTLRGCLHGQIARYRSGLSMGRAERRDLDECLADLGQSPLGAALATALRGQKRLLWSADGLLHGLPVSALRFGTRYLVETHEIAMTFSGSLSVYHARTRRRARGWWRPAVIVAEDSTVLPGAAREGDGVADAFFWSRTLRGAAGTRAALRQEFARARIVHLACHARFDEEQPLAAHLVLPSGEILLALECLDESLRDLPLVTLSGCRSGEVGSVLGGEVFGIVTGLLGGGVRAVLASLWPVADREATGLMWEFYRARMGADLAAALAHAQRSSLRRPESSPLFWAAFTLFGDPGPHSPPGWIGQLLTRWRQARHARKWKWE